MPAELKWTSGLQRSGSLSVLTVRGADIRAFMPSAILLRQFEKCLAKDQLLPLLKGNPGQATQMKISAHDSQGKNQKDF